MTGSYADRLNVMRRYGAPPEIPFYALFLPPHLIKLRFGHIKRRAREAAAVSLCRRRLGQRKIPLDANVIDKQPGASVKPPKHFRPHGPSQQQATGAVYTFLLFFFFGKIQSRCSTSNSRGKDRVSAALSAAAEVKELCPHQRSVTVRLHAGHLRLTTNDLENTPPAPYFIKSLIRCVRGVGTLFRSGRGRVNCLNKS